MKESAKRAAPVSMVAEAIPTSLANHVVPVHLAMRHKTGPYGAELTKLGVWKACDPASRSACASKAWRSEHFEGIEQP